MHDYPYVDLMKVQTVTVNSLKETETKARRSFKGM